MYRGLMEVLLSFHYNLFFQNFQAKNTLNILNLKILVQQNGSI